jgi:uncharacterized protein YdeI (YjbR/CyaY-like superfamily)
MEVRFFSTPDHFRKWLQKNHNKANELWVGYYKKSSGKPSITWPESVDQALCFGWIDGIRKSIDAESYKIRFTPRKPSSHWSKINVNKVSELKKQGLMMPAGLKAFKKMRKDNSKEASYEQKVVEIPVAYFRQFRKNKKAWKYYQQQTPSYRKITTWWIISAKKEETRIKRLNKLIKDSEINQKISPLL